MRRNRDIYLTNRKTTDVDWAIQNARIVIQAATFKWGSGDGAKVRDQAMADNVGWILEHSPGTKIVVWAHNDHIAKEPDQLGGYLSVRHLSNYKTFGFAFHEGRYNANAGNGRSAWDASVSYPGSVEYVLHQSGIPRFILDLHAATGKPGAWLRQGLDWRNIGSVRIDGFGPNARLGSQFDALIFFDRTTPTHLLPIPARPAP
jgi:erythromycin esterase